MLQLEAPVFGRGVVAPGFVAAGRPRLVVPDEDQLEGTRSGSRGECSRGAHSDHGCEHYPDEGLTSHFVTSHVSKPSSTADQAPHGAFDRGRMSLDGAKSPPN